MSIQYRYLAVLSLLAVLNACLNAGGPIEGSGVPSAETRTFDGVDRLLVSGSLSVQVDVDPSHTGPVRVDVSGDDNLLDGVETVVDGTELRIDTNRPLSEQVPLSIVITAASLSRIGLSGSGHIDVAGEYGAALELMQDGSGTIVAHGRADALTVTRSGSGAVQAGTLDATSVEIDSSGSGHAWVCANESVSGSRGGSGDLVVRCDPESVEIEDLGSDTTVGEVILLP